MEMRLYQISQIETGLVVMESGLDPVRKSPDFSWKLKSGLLKPKSGPKQDPRIQYSKHYLVTQIEQRYRTLDKLNSCKKLAIKKLIDRQIAGSTVDCKCFWTKVLWKAKDGKIKGVHL